MGEQLVIEWACEGHLAHINDLLIFKRVQVCRSCISCNAPSRLLTRPKALISLRDRLDRCGVSFVHHFLLVVDIANHAWVHLRWVLLLLTVDRLRRLHLMLLLLRSHSDLLVEVLARKRGQRCLIRLSL